MKLKEGGLPLHTQTDKFRSLGEYTHLLNLCKTHVFPIKFLFLKSDQMLIYSNLCYGLCKSFYPGDYSRRRSVT